MFSNVVLKFNYVKHIIAHTYTYSYNKKQKRLHFIWSNFFSLENKNIFFKK